MSANNEVTLGGGLPGRDYGDVLWEPAPGLIQRARITDFRRWLINERGVGLRGGAESASYQELWDWSVTEPGQF
ncbi:MAG TPA: acetoacetate--CoA ligase, partial [Streptosporangiaceae bacterium]